MAEPSLLGTATAVAAVPFERVEPLLTEAGSRLLLGLDQSNPAAVAVDVDPAAATISMQGQFWYRGEFAFAPHSGGTEVTYRIKNVSGWPDVVIKFWQRKLLDRQRRELDAFVGALPVRLE